MQMEKLLHKIATEIGMTDRAIEVMEASPECYKEAQTAIDITTSLMRNDESDWGRILFGKNTNDLLQNDIYSPLQYLIFLELTKLGAEKCSDYPFLLNMVSNVVHDSLDKQVSSSDIKMILQNVFLLRERREERQRLSLEIILPLQDDSNRNNRIGLKGFSQIFGRGIAYTRDPNLGAELEPKIKPSSIFHDHKNAPLSSIYDLLPPYPHIETDQMSVILRNDGHIALAKKANPLLEFYDGGWHVCDLASARLVLSTSIERFGPEKIKEGFVEKLVNLAYHMGSHWHGGLIAVIEPEAIEQIFMNSEGENEEIQTAVVNELNSSSGEKWQIGGGGRLLLTTLIHDGATVFSPSGDLLGTGKLVKLGSGGQIKGGSRRNAARKIAENGGVAIYISQDGAIKIFSNETGDDGLRVH